MVLSVHHVFPLKIEKYRIKNVYAKLIIINLMIQILVLNVLLLVMNVKIMEMEHSVFNVNQVITEVLMPINNVYV